MDGPAARDVIAAFGTHAVDLVIDYEHQTLGAGYSSPDGKAPAAGWIKALFARPGVGLFGRVSWTQEAVGELSARKYRYLSPVLLVRKSDGRAVELHSAALTNKPAIAGMAALVNKSDSSRKVVNAMSDYEQLLGKLRSLLGLSSADDEATVLAALQQAIGSTSANSEGRIDLTRFVARADYDAAVRRANGAEGELLAMKAESFISDGMRKGKISFATRDHWLRAFSASPEQAQADLDQEPVKFPVSGRLINKEGARAPFGGADRRTVINVARIEYENEPGLRKLVGGVDHINGELRQAGHSPLSKEEAAAIGGRIEG